MTPTEAARLAELLREKRLEAGLSANELARRAGVNVGTVTRIELGQIASPRPENLRAMGDVLGISAADLFAATDWLPPEELPSFRPYLRAKYGELPPEALAALERRFQEIADQYGTGGPKEGEDER